MFGNMMAAAVLISVMTGAMASALARSVESIITSSATGLPISAGAVRIYAASSNYLNLAFPDNAGNSTYGDLAAGAYFAVAMMFCEPCTERPLRAASNFLG